MKTRTKFLTSLVLILSTILFPSSIWSQIEISHPLKLAEGSVQRIHFETKEIGERNVDIWLPKGYSPQQKYSVLYMHDGQMLYDATTSWNKKSWHVDSTMQQLIDNNIIEQTIVVGIWNSANRHAEYFPQKSFEYMSDSAKNALLLYMPSGALADKYLDFIVHELKPFVDATYSVHTDMRHTHIAGSSMGGLISLYAICQYPNIFGGAGCISTHWIGVLDRNNEIPNALNTYVNNSLPTPKNHKIYFDYGTVGLDANYPEFQHIIDQTLKQHNYDKQSTISLEFVGNDHSEDYWSARLHYMLEFLLTK